MVTANFNEQEVKKALCDKLGVDYKKATIDISGFLEDELTFIITY